MSKELFTSDITNDMIHIAVDATVTELDDLHLALIGGGEGVVAI